MTALRLAIVGVGDVAQRDYLPEFHRLAGRAEIVAVCGVHADRAKDVAARFGVPRWSTDYRAVVESGDVDAVVNLTPIPVHHEITLAALRAGRHVYTEKPLASSVGAAQELLDEAERRKLVLVCAPSILLFPQLRRVREILASGLLGEILAARAHAIAGPPPWAGYESDPRPFFSAEGGPLVDMAVYPLHALSGLLGPVASVSALSSAARSEFIVEDGPYAGQRVPVEADDTWQLLLKVGSCLASVESNFSTAGSPTPECELRGERGGVAFSLLDVSAPISQLSEGSEEWVEEAVEHERESGPDHILGVEHLVQCVASGERPVASAEHAIHVLDVIDGARRSASEGRTIAIAQRSMIDWHAPARGDS
jgi:predicted dehydrogenase